MIRFFQNFLQDSTLLRVFLFLRVRAPFSRRYAWVFPVIVSVFFVAILWLLPNNIRIWNESGLISKFIPVLSVVFPFYVAALAAVSTFSGNGSIDEGFPPDRHGNRVYMLYRGSGGELYEVAISQRHYLSLLFGYCSILSLALLIFVAISSVVSAGVMLEEGVGRDIISYSLIFLFSVFFSQLVSLTMLAVYYLADKIHRPIEKTGDDVLRSIDKDRSRGLD